MQDILQIVIHIKNAVSQEKKSNISFLIDKHMREGKNTTISQEDFLQFKQETKEKIKKQEEHIKDIEENSAQNARELIQVQHRVKLLEKNRRGR